MKLTPRLSRALVMLGLAALAGVPLCSQTILFTQLDGKFVAVRSARQGKPMVEQEGKLVVADGRRYVLQKTAEYRPEFVAVSKLQAKSQHLNVEGSEMNHTFTLYVTVETRYYLEDVFLVLELDTERAGKVLFLQGIGILEPNTPRNIAVTVPTQGALGEGKFKYHLYSAGLELMTSQLPPPQRDQLLDGMISRRIAGVTEAQPKLYSGPQPEYPARLRKAGKEGKAVIAVRIDARGRVMDPQVKEASDPAFGEAALVAVRLWRFLPRIQEGRPVETQANLPVNFDPPDGKKN